MDRSGNTLFSAIVVYNKHMNPDKKKPERLRRNVVNEIAGIGPWLAGAVIMRYGKCANKDCACHSGEKKHPSMAVTYRDNGKSRSLYVPRSMWDEVKEWIDNYHKLKKLLQEGTDIQVNAVRHRDKQAGYPSVKTKKP